MYDFEQLFQENEKLNFCKQDVENGFRRIGTFPKILTPHSKITISLSRCSQCIGTFGTHRMYAFEFESSPYSRKSQVNNILIRLEEFISIWLFNRIRTLILQTLNFSAVPRSLFHFSVCFSKTPPTVFQTAEVCTCLYLFRRFHHKRPRFNNNTNFGLDRKPIVIRVFIIIIFVFISVAPDRGQTTETSLYIYSENRRPFYFIYTNTTHLYCWTTNKCII